VRLLVLVVSLLAGCAGSPTTPVRSFDVLPRPLVLVTHDVGDNCNGTLAIDAGGDVWHESGCEERSSGVNRTSHLSEVQRSRLGAALDALRRAPAAQAMSHCAHFPTRFVLREADGSHREWSVCPPEESSPWPAPFADVFAAIQ
jgi:hypothetical protein